MFNFLTKLDINQIAAYSGKQLQVLFKYLLIGIFTRLTALSQ